VKTAVVTADVSLGLSADAKSEPKESPCFTASWDDVKHVFQTTKVSGRFGCRQHGGKVNVVH